jgi:lauroyl/myristoyl acyltransferase
VLEVAAGIGVIVLALLLPLALVGGLGAAAARVLGRRRRERALDIA